MDNIDTLTQIIRDLRVLPDRSAAGQLRGDQYAAEWRRLETERRVISAMLTPDELRVAHERAQYAC